MGRDTVQCVVNETCCDRRRKLSNSALMRCEQADSERLNQSRWPSSHPHEHVAEGQTQRRSDPTGMMSDLASMADC